MALIAALLALLAAPAAPFPGHEPPARLEVLEGRARVALATGVVRLDGAAPAQQLVGPAHVELAAASRARVGWSGTASLRLEGRTVLEWEAPEQRGQPLRWVFAEVDIAHLEVRRGLVHLELPGGWAGRLEAGAYTLEGLAGGAIELRHDAGLPATLWPPRVQGEPRPPFTVLAGASLRLLGEVRRPIALPGSGSRLEEPHAKLGFEMRAAATPASAPWEGFAWPWTAPPEATQASEAVYGEVVHPSGRGPLGEALPPEPDDGLTSGTPAASQPEGDSAGLAPAAAPPGTGPWLPELPTVLRLALPAWITLAEAGLRDQLEQPPAGRTVGVAPEVPALEPEPAPSSGGILLTPEQLRGIPFGPEPETIGPDPRAPLQPPPTGTPQGRPWPVFPPVRSEGILILSPYGPRWLELRRQPQAPPAGEARPPREDRSGNG